MSATVKQEWSRPDGWHLGHRLARKARPAGRLVAVVAAEMAADDVTTLEAFEQAEADEVWWAEHERLAA